MKKIAIIVFASLLVIFNTSCKKEIDTVREGLSEYKYLAKFDEIRKTKVNGGHLRVMNHHANFGASPSDIVTSVRTQTSESFFNKIDFINLNDYEITISDFSTREVFKEDKEDFFGREITITLGNSIEREGEALGPYYVPEILCVDMPTENEEKVLRDGSVITWNADPLNEEGVLIIVDYAGWDKNTSERESQIEIEVVPDNGSYTFSKSDFPLIPEESLVVLRVIRGIYDFIDIENFSGEHEKDLLFLVSTESAGFSRIK